MAKTVKVGDTVKWCGSFGRALPMEAVVTRMEITEEPRQKEGIPAEEVFWSLVRENKVVFSLDNGSWAYGSQICPL